MYECIDTQLRYVVVKIYMREKGIKEDESVCARTPDTYFSLQNLLLIHTLGTPCIAFSFNPFIPALTQKWPFYFADIALTKTFLKSICSSANKSHSAVHILNVYF